MSYLLHSHEVAYGARGGRRQRRRPFARSSTDAAPPPRRPGCRVRARQRAAVGDGFPRARQQRQPVDRARRGASAWGLCSARATRRGTRAGPDRMPPPPPNHHHPPTRVQEQSCAQSTTLERGTRIRLQHMETRRWLHSHMFQSPLSNNQEVSCFGANDQSDTGEGEGWRSGRRSAARQADALRAAAMHPPTIARCPPPAKMRAQATFGSWNGTTPRRSTGRGICWCGCGTPTQVPTCPRTT